VEAPAVMRVASALVLIVVVGLSADHVRAQAIGQPDKPGWSPEGYLLSFGVGAYRPDPGSAAFDLVYPSGQGPVLLPEFDFFLYRIPYIGPIGIGLNGGWASYKGSACEADTITPTGCTPSTQQAKFSLFPLNAYVVLRIDALARKTAVPFVLTGKVGFASIFFNEDIGNGKQSGRSHGFGWAAQLAVELNFINERRANALDEDWGINSSFFYFELAGNDANSGAPVGDKLYFLGGVGITF
jgi:hypothetical protein